MRRTTKDDNTADTLSSLAKVLTNSANKYAFRSLTSYMQGEWSDFALFAGIAIEHAAKARLGNANAVFLAPDRNFKASIALNRASGDARLLPDETQTVGAKLALERCVLLHPDLKEPLDKAGSLIAKRNGEAHMGYPGVEPSRQEFVRFISAMESLSLGPMGQLWGHHESYVKEAVDERTQRVHEIVEEKLATARTRFGNLVDGKKPSGLEKELKSAEVRRDTLIDNDETMALDCPACEQAAVVLGHTEQTGTDAEIDEDGIGGAWPILTFFLESLKCETCGLTLDNEAELQAAQVDVSWINEDIDLDEWMKANWADDNYY